MSNKIIIFACSWDGWSCIDSAAHSGMPYPLPITVLKLPCLSSINAGMILRAVEYGADGVLILGCQPHACNYGNYGNNIDLEFDRSRQIISMLGKNSNMIRLVRLEAFDGSGFIEAVRSFAAALGTAGARSTSGKKV